MDVLLQHDLDDVNWEELATLFRLAPLGDRDLDQLKRAFENSYFTVVAQHENRVVGAGRVISDGEYYANIYDIVVLPEFQGQGIGRRMMQDLLDRIGSKFILLTTTLGKEPFYAKLGFRRHKTAMAIYPPGTEENARLYVE